MKNFLLKFIKQKNINLNTNLKFENLKKKYEIKKIFNIFSNDLNNCQIRFIGGCVRKALSNENVDDIDLAVDLTPEEVKLILKNNNIKFFETGIEHGTITAKINNEKFEITSLRRDIKSYGRHADVEFTKKWYEDAARRDFSINCIYADLEGNLYDPFEGKKDLKNGKVKFIGNAENRIREDYLRVLRYIRFFLDYSNQPHDLDIQKQILKNISGINKISKERLLSELEKIFKSKNIFKINDDEFLVKILNLVFPELKNIRLLEKLNDQALEILQSKDFLFWLSILIIDETDNTDYFLYKYKLSNNDKRRMIRNIASEHKKDENETSHYAEEPNDFLDQEELPQVKEKLAESGEQRRQALLRLGARILDSDIGKKMDLNTFILNRIVIAELIKVNELEGVEKTEISEGINRYTIGTYTSIQGAMLKLNKLTNQGYKGSYIISFYEGKQISIKKAKQLIGF